MKSPAIILAGYGIMMSSIQSTGMSEVIVGFENAQEAQRWTTVNDGVMGGLSDGRFEITDSGTLKFFGTVSLENNGGFASIRSLPDERDLSEYEGILVRLRGDGRRYALNLRTNVRIMAGSYRVKFDTEPGKWQEIFFPFESFQATSFGAAIDTAPPLDVRRIQSFGFLISDKQAGPFNLEVDWIKASARPEA